jgi:hypothetical protein
VEPDWTERNAGQCNMYLPPFLDLRVGFSKCCAAVPATTDTLRGEVFRIRGDVDCLEFT